MGNRHGGLYLLRGMRASLAVCLRREGLTVSDVPIDRHFVAGMFSHLSVAGIVGSLRRRRSDYVFSRCDAISAPTREYSPS